MFGQHDCAGLPLSHLVGHPWRRVHAGPFLTLVPLALGTTLAIANDTPVQNRHSIAELTPIARIHLGKTADWVAITDDAVWVGTTGPNGVAEIDPRTNTVAAIVHLAGNP